MILQLVARIRRDLAKHPLSFYRRRLQGVLARRVPGEKVNGSGLSWRMVAERETEHCYEFAFEVPVGYSVEDILKQTDALYAACGAIVDIVDRAGVVQIAVFPEEFPNKIHMDEQALTRVEKGSILVGFDRRMGLATHCFNIPHMLVCGQSGYGKTDFIRLIIYQLIRQFGPEELEIFIIDMKGFSFLPFRNVPHIRKIVTKLPEAVSVLEESYNEMQRRADEILEKSDRSLARDFKWRLIIVDEASQISPDLQVDQKVKQIARAASQLAASISCIGREARVGLIYATQYPTAQVIHGQIRANMESVVCFKTENDVHSNVALNSSGAELITAQGRAIFKTRGNRTMVQVPFVGDDGAWTRLLAKFSRGDGHDQADRAKEADTQPLFGTTDCFQSASTAAIDWRDSFPSEASVRPAVRTGERQVDNG